MYKKKTLIYKIVLIVFACLVFVFPARDNASIDDKALVSVMALDAKGDDRTHRGYAKKRGRSGVAYYKFNRSRLPRGVSQFGKDVRNRNGTVSLRRNDYRRAIKQKGI